jgi:hypothetical protein
VELPSPRGHDPARWSAEPAEAHEPASWSGEAADYEAEAGARAERGGRRSGEPRTESGPDYARYSATHQAAAAAKGGRGDYARAPAHRAVETAAPGASTPGSRRRNRASSEPDDRPAYPQDDELSRIFAGAVGPPRPSPVEQGTGARRRRHREDDESNDVLSRLLGRP